MESCEQVPEPLWQITHRLPEPNTISLPFVNPSKGGLISGTANPAIGPNVSNVPLNPVLNTFQKPFPCNLFTSSSLFSMCLPYNSPNLKAVS